MKDSQIMFIAMFAAAAVILGGIGYFVIFSDGVEPYDDGTGTPDNTDDTDGTDDGGDTTTVDLAQDFILPEVGGGNVKLSDLRGKIVLLDFMATWCGPCESQNDHLKTIRQQYSSSEVVILSIDVDVGEGDSLLLDYISDQGITWQVLRDTSNIASLSDYDATSIPTLVIINRDGEIAYRNVGVTAADVLAAEINDIMIYG